MNDDDEDYPPLEDADIDDVSSNASVGSESSESVSIDSDTETGGSHTHRSNGDGNSHHRYHQDHTVITEFNRMMETGIKEENEEDFENEEEEELDGMAGDHKRRRGSVGDQDSGDDELGEPIIVPLKTGSDHGDEEESALSSPLKPLGRRTTRSREAALERNAIRRQSSNEMLQAMQKAAREHSKDRSAVESDSAGGEFSRRPPSRTKSGEQVMIESTATAGEFSRRPPSRTKSGERLTKGVLGGEASEASEAGPRRRPPPRTKSGDGFQRRAPQATNSGEFDLDTEALFLSSSRKHQQRQQSREISEGEDFTGTLPNEASSDEVLLSPGGKGRRTLRGDVDRETALKRNAARRQKSNDMLGAMRDATRMPPPRSQSSTAGFGGIAAPSPQTEGVRATPAGLEPNACSPTRRVPRRRPPERTKSGAVVEPVPFLQSSA